MEGVVLEEVVAQALRDPGNLGTMLRTADAASPLDAPAVGASLLAFVVVYFFVFGAGVWYILHLMHKLVAFLRSCPTSDVQTCCLLKASHTQ
mgnify:CR=1 FL=1